MRNRKKKTKKKTTKNLPTVTKKDKFHPFCFVTHTHSHTHTLMDEMHFQNNVDIWLHIGAHTLNNMPHMHIRLSD